MARSIQESIQSSVDIVVLHQLRKELTDDVKELTKSIDDTKLRIFVEENERAKEFLEDLVQRNQKTLARKEKELDSTKRED